MDYEDFLDDVSENVEEFEELYGFTHDCHCAEDWESGETGPVSKCYTELMDAALTQCHVFKGEIADMERKLAILRLQVVEHGEKPRV